MVSSDWPRLTIESLIATGAIIGHKDGNYGSLYPRVEEFGTVGVPFLTAKSIINGNLDIDNAPRLAEERADTLRFGFVLPNDVLLSHNATIGRVAIVPEFNGRLLVGTSLTYFRLEPCKLLPRIPAFARRARSAFYADPQQAKPMTTVAAWQAFAQRVPGAAKIWMERLHAVSRAPVETILNQVPPSRMSSVCREFTLQLLLENQSRLVAGEIE